MSGAIIAFPRGRSTAHGTVHVMGTAGAFEIAHESASGSSWGWFDGPFARGQDAIAAAYRLNSETLGRECDVSICDAALADVPPSRITEFERFDF